MKVSILVKDRCFKEMVDCISASLLNMNISVELTDYNQPLTGGTMYIIVGKDLISLLDLPANYIIVQIETLSDVSKEEIDSFLGYKYINALENAKFIWEHSQLNINILQKNYKISNIYHLPFYYSKTIDFSSSVSSKIKEYDIFFNEPNEKIPRRKELLDKLKKKYNVYVSTDNIWSKEKLQILYKSKVVLHILYYDTDNIELLDLWYMLNNKSFIISEKSSSGSNELDDFIETVSYDKIETTIESFLKSEEKIMMYQRQKYSKWLQTNFTEAIINFPLFKNNTITTTVRKSSKKNQKKK